MDHGGLTSLEQAENDFQIFVHPRGSALQTEGSSFGPKFVPKGVQLRFDVTSVVEDTLPSFASIDLAKRKCYLPSDSAAVQEVYKCLEQTLTTLAVEQCQCNPWNLKLDVAGVKNICGTKENRACFDQVMTNTTVKDGALTQCPPMCKNVAYYTPVLKSEIPLANGTSLHQYIVNGCNNCSKIVPPIHQILKSRMLPSKPEAHIESRLSQMSLVTISLANSTMGVLTKSAEVTLLDKVGYIGGTLGILIGFSFMACHELIAKALDFLLSGKSNACTFEIDCQRNCFLQTFSSSHRSLQR